MRHSTQWDIIAAWAWAGGPTCAAARLDQIAQLWNIICDIGVVAASRLPVAAVMEILRLDRQQYYEWRKLGLLGPRQARERLSRAEARELAILAELQRVIGGTKAGIAYRQVRSLVIARDLDQTPEIMWIDQDRWAGLVESADQFISEGRRGLAMQLIPVHEEVGRVLAAFDRDAAGRA